MPHIIETIRNVSIPDAICALERTHRLIVDSVIKTQPDIEIDSNNWGSKLKRLEVNLPTNTELIGKSNEKYIEVINILATTERTISALKWLSNKYPNCIVRECHSSTSDDADGNDIVLVDKGLKILVRCEVTDVISKNATQNGKEKKDLRNLGCRDHVPNDSINRYIATSNEFANALTSPKRKWNILHYRYLRHETGLDDQTTMLEILQTSKL